MNEKIKELIEQAEDYAAEQHAPYTHYERMLRYEIFKEKFAYLIVQECSEIAHCNFHVDGLTLGSILKEHFGVK